MREAVEAFRGGVEKSVFGVCQSVGDRWGIKPSKVRIYFIYTSFIGMGSPLIIYLVMAFWLNIKKYFVAEEEILWD